MIAIKHTHHLLKGYYFLTPISGWDMASRMTLGRQRHPSLSPRDLTCGNALSQTSLQKLRRMQEEKKGGDAERGKLSVQYGM